MKTKRILILSAGYGEGHNSAARALKAAFCEHPGVDVRLLDIFAEVAPRMDLASRRIYLGMINRAPWLWKAFYGWLDRSVLAEHLLGSLVPHRHALARHLREFGPDAVCSTYPIYGWLLDRIRREGRPVPPVYTIVTDALTINSLWHRVPSNRWFVTDAGSAAVMARAGVPSDRLAVSGFPVALDFADRGLELQPPDLRTGAPQRILYMINSGNASVLETARFLMSRPGRHVTITAGRNDALRARLETMARGAPASVEVMGWTKRVPELLMTHHMVVSKAGGATTQESINALCPMIVNQIVPGQEEGNWELLHRNGAGVRAESPEAIAQAIDEAFAHDGGLLLRWRQALQMLAKPAAARTIAQQILGDVTVSMGPSSVRSDETAKRPG